MPIDPLSRVVMNAVEESRQREIERANDEMAATQRKLEAIAKEHPEMLPTRRALLVLGITGMRQKTAKKESVKITERRSRRRLKKVG